MTNGVVALSAEGVRVRLGKRIVVEDVDVTAPFGAITALVGPNGAGKTTLLKALAGLLPSDGCIRVAGTELTRLAASERARRVAYVPQRSLLEARLSVRQVVELARYAHRGGTWAQYHGDAAAIDHALGAVGARELEHRLYSELSGGEQRRVLMARALATGAKVVLLDEPTASLDVRHALALFGLLRQLASDGYCVVAVLHDLDDVRRFADQALLLSAGRAVAFGSSADVTSAAHVASVYDVSLIERDRVGFRALSAE